MDSALGGYMIAAPVKYVSMKAEGSLVHRDLMTLTNFTDIGVYLIARGMLVVNPTRRQTVMDSDRQLPPPS